MFDCGNDDDGVVVVTMMVEAAKFAHSGPTRFSEAKEHFFFFFLQELVASCCISKPNSFILSLIQLTNILEHLTSGGYWLAMLDKNRAKLTAQWVRETG